MNANPTQSGAVSWELFDSWPTRIEPPGYSLNWTAFDELVACYEKIVERKYEALMPLIRRWDNLLRELGDDPTHHDWSRFRPLRLTREEDWSDWLAHLIGTSRTGVLARYLFENPVHVVPNHALPKDVHREVSHRGFRADIIVEWQCEHFSHIEIKIGDSSLQKTYGTSVVLREKFKARPSRWSNFILLLPPQLALWDSEQEPADHAVEVIAITWSDVCVGIRRALRARETISWKAWAYSFLGAIEQLLIGFPGHLMDKKMMSLNMDEKILILERGLEDD